MPVQAYLNCKRRDQNHAKVLGKDVLFSLQNHHRAHQAQHDSFEPWMLAQEDCDIADERCIGPNAADDVGRSVKKVLVSSIQLDVVAVVVVSFGQQLQRLVPGSRSARRNQHPGTRERKKKTTD